MRCLWGTIVYEAHSLMGSVASDLVECQSNVKGGMFTYRILDILYVYGMSSNTLAEEVSASNIACVYVWTAQGQGQVPVSQGQVNM